MKINLLAKAMFYATSIIAGILVAIFLILLLIKLLTFQAVILGALGIFLFTVITAAIYDELKRKQDVQSS